MTSKQATLHRSFIEKPLGLLVLTLTCPPLALITIWCTVNTTETYTILGMFIAIFLLVSFVLSIAFNIIFLINNRQFKKFEAHHELNWTVSEDEWVTFWEMNYELEKKYALAMFKYNLWFAPIILVAFGFTLYTAKYFGDDYLIVWFSILFIVPLILIFMFPLAFRFRSKRLLKRAQKGNVPIYLNHKMIYVNGNIIFLKQFYSDMELKLLYKPIPHIEITRSIHPINDKVFLLEKLLGRFIDKKYLRAANITRIPLPQDKETIEQISTILGLSDQREYLIKQLMGELKENAKNQKLSEE